MESAFAVCVGELSPGGCAGRNSVQVGLSVAAPLACLVHIILICNPCGPSSQGRYKKEWQFLGIIAAPASLCIKTRYVLFEL